MALQDMLNGGGLQQAVSSVTGIAETGENKHGRTLRAKHFTADPSADTVDLTPSEHRSIGTYTVGAQERYRWGQGTSEHWANQGIFYLDARDDANAAINGEFRVEQTDANNRERITVDDDELDRVRNSKTDPQNGYGMPEQVSYPKVGRDSKLRITIEPESAVTFSWANSEVSAPVTVYPV